MLQKRRPAGHYPGFNLLCCAVFLIAPLVAVSAPNFPASTQRSNNLNLLDYWTIFQKNRASAMTGGPASRVTLGLQALYPFDAGTGSTVFDVSGAGVVLDLTIANPENTQWGSGTLTVLSSTQLSSAGAATRLNDAIAGSNEITLEAWIQPENITQTGPARIVSLSPDLFNRNVTLGQGVSSGSAGNRYNVRLRTTTTGMNGNLPSLSSSSGSLTTNLMHVVYTRDSSGVATIYLDGAFDSSTTISGNLFNWDSNFGLVLANEQSGDRPWLGTFHLVAFYDRALTAAEVSQNYSAGANASNGPNNPPVALDDNVNTDENTPITGNVLVDNGNGEDSDPDMHVLFVSEVNSSGSAVGMQTQTTLGALVIVQANGDFDYSPNGQFGTLNPGEQAVDTFTYTVNDAHSGTDTATVSVVVDGVAGNNLPPVAVDDLLTTDKFSTLTGNLLDNNGNGPDSDPNLDPIEVVSVNVSGVGSQISTSMGALLTVEADGSFSYFPNNQFNILTQGQFAQDTFVYTIDDGTGSTDSATVTVTVNGLDDPYTLIFAGSSTYTLDNPHDIKLSLDNSKLFVSDVENDRVVVLDANSLEFISQWGSDHQDGTHDIDFDSQGRAYVADTFNDRVTVYDINPVTNEGVLLPQLELSATNLETVEGVLVHPNGRVYVTGIVSKNVVVFDNGSVVNSTRLDAEGGLFNPHDVEVTPAGDIWLADSDNDRMFLLDPDTLAVKQTLGGPDFGFNGVRYQDIRPDNVLVAADKDTHSIKIISPDGALLQVLGTEGVPGLGQNVFRTPEGVEILGNVLWLSDSGNDRVVKYWMVDSSANAEPLAQNDSVTVNVSNSVVFDVRNNDIDENSLTSIPIVVAQPSRGNVTVNSVTGFVTYTADNTAPGSDSFNYTITDDAGLTSNVAKVSVTVDAIPGSPLAVNDSEVVPTRGAFRISVLSNDMGAIDASTVMVVTSASHGVARGNTDGTINYLHNGSGSSDSFAYTVRSDTGVLSNDATVFLTFNAPGNLPPVAANDTANTSNGSPVIITVLANDSDFDGGLIPATVSVLTNPGNGTAEANADGTITYTHTAGTSATDLFQYTVDDTSGAVSNPATVQIEITGVASAPPVVPNDNQPPVAIADSAALVSSESVIIDLTGNDFDPDGTVIDSSALITAIPSNGTVTNHRDGSVTYTHVGPDRQDSFQYTVDDDRGDSSVPAQVTISVIDRTGDRVTDDLAVLYHFSAGTGLTVYDQSGELPPLDLTITDSNAVSWGAGTLSVDRPTTIRSDVPVTRLKSAISESDELTIECWVISTGLLQTGPARIVSLSIDAYSRSVTLGQNGDRVQVRLRTSTTDPNGIKRSLQSPAGSFGTARTHVVYTRAADGSARLFLNNQEVSFGQVGGNLSVWDDADSLILANEFIHDRPWLGHFDLVALYSRALTTNEISRNFDAGP